MSSDTGGDAVTATAWAAADGVGLPTLQRIAAAWPSRAAVRGSGIVPDDDAEYDPSLPDYPAHLVPFANHPRFLAAPEPARRQVLTGLWLGYNERVIETERLIAGPAFDLIMSGHFPGSEHDDIRKAVQQSIVDESYHTYMHMMAITRTRRLRGIATRPRQPQLVTYRRLRQALDGMPERWERDIAVLVWGAVAETCINALLALIARDRGIQPMHSLVTTLHLRDESAHGSVVVEVVKVLHERMNGAQRRVLARCLPLALQAFSEQDPSTLRVELEHAGVAGVDEIIGDLRSAGTGQRLVRDFSGAERMVRELGISDEVSFDFPAAPEWAGTVRDVAGPDATVT